MTTKDLFANFLHIGHFTKNWNPKMKKFLFGSNNKIHIFDLTQTVDLLDKAKQFLSASKLKNEKVIFVGTKPQTSIILREKLKDTSHFFIDQKWQPGLFTNFTEIRKRIDHYLNLKSQFESGEINKYTKKEVAMMKKELEKLDKMYSGVAGMRAKPSIIIVLDAVVDRLAIDEANVANVAVVSVVDSNANPDGIDFVIPANDDSIKSISFTLDEILTCLKK